MNAAVGPISPPTPRTNFITDRAFPSPMTPTIESQIFDLNLARLCSLNVEDNPILPAIASPDTLGDLLNSRNSLDGSFALNNLQALAKLDNMNINNNNSKIFIYFILLVFTYYFVKFRCASKLDESISFESIWP